MESVVFWSFVICGMVLAMRGALMSLQFLAGLLAPKPTTGLDVVVSFGDNADLPDDLVWTEVPAKGFDKRITPL